MLKLIIEDDEGKTTVVPLIRDEISIGRKEGNTIRLTERNVSRKHARILRRNGAVYLEDLNSYNGIKVNGTRIQGQVTVAEGDRIQIGDYMLALKQDQPAAEQAPSDPFDDMKTVPVEQAEAKALQNHIAAKQAAQGAAPAPAATPPAAAPAPAPAPEAEEGPSQQRHQDLIEEAAAAKSAEAPAKLVVVSANYAGMECLLDKAAQVIGRTEDNDIVIDHRSVSKHHAKIVREGGSYTIVDQGSSNGIFVNGEKYDRVELRPGDMVDLGHVRMRFVGAGEAWVFDPSTAVDTGPEVKKSGGGLIAIIGLVVIVGAVVGILFGTGVIGGKKKDNESKGDQQDATQPTSPDAMEGPMAAPADYQKIRDAISQKDWKSAIREADAILINNQNDPLGRKLKQKAVEEQKAEEHRSSFFQALRSGNWEKAVFDGTQVATDSVYYTEVSKRLVEVKQKYKKQLIQEAKRLHRARECAQLKSISQKMQTLDNAETAITELERSCRPKEGPIAMAMEPPEPMDMGEPRPPMHRPMRPRTRPMRVTMDRPPPRRTSDEGPSASKLLAEARAALMANQNGKAIRLARASIKKKWSSSAWAVLGVAACKAGRKGTAKTAYKALRGGRRNMLVSVCKASGITLP